MNRPAIKASEEETVVLFLFFFFFLSTAKVFKQEGAQSCDLSDYKFLLVLILKEVHAFQMGQNTKKPKPVSTKTKHEIFLFWFIEG
ncbi:hypothetical protein Q3G72_029665 [Acer saccharum]|nr:hypothetical protein Q3G72_029665 [Acer saccharum]